MSSINFCDLADATTPFPHFWEHTVGSDHGRLMRKCPYIINGLRGAGFSGGWLGSATERL